MHNPRIFLIVAVCAQFPHQSMAANPLLDSWLTAYSGRYARVYETTADLNAGTSKTTWSRGSVSQTLPAYSGVQEIFYSANWVYIRSSGLGSHIMGPWYLNAAKTQLFPNVPGNTRTIYRFPRTPAVPTTKTLTGLGTIGYFVDGVSMFDGRDAFYWNGTTEVGGGNGLWNRDAYVNEAVTFDPANAHQEQTGTYHYHANPIALRYLLEDHVVFNDATKTYNENPTALHHSPILGWVRDGFPIYGPYGYSDATNPASGIRRMISGFVRRDGQNGTVNLAAAGRSTLPAWAARTYNRSATLAANEYGPAVSTQYPLGRYIEDNEHLSDLGRTQGMDFDLDEYNGRFCVTPEFPNGTYAYFVTIAANGAPAFPYNIGRAYYGTPAGGAVTTLAEPVTTNFVGGASSEFAITDIKRSNGQVTLAWSAVEGGTYQVQRTDGFAGWTTVASNISAQQIIGRATNSAPEERSFYQVQRTALANYDAGTTTSGGNGGISSISPTSGTRGSSVSATITLSANANPAVPPQNAPVNSVTIGTIAGSSVSRPTQYTIQATFNIPANAATGAQTVTVVFPGPPGNPTATVTYTLTNGFTVQ